MINPLKEARLDRNLTQAQLAKLAGMSSNAVVKYEHGLYSLPSDNIIHALWEWDRNKLKTGIPYQEFWASLCEKYQAWRVHKKTHANSTLTSRGFTIPPNTTAHPLTIWRICLGLNSQMEFCKLLAIHPSIMSQYESGKTRSMPTELHDSLTMASVGSDFIDYLDTRGEEYHDRLH